MGAGTHEIGRKQSFDSENQKYSWSKTGPHHCVSGAVYGPLYDEVIQLKLTSLTHFYLKMSTAERALIDISQDRRYWIIHSITIPSLFVGGVIFMLSGFVYKLFGALNFNKYFDKDNSSISLIKDRFSICSSMDDI